MGRRRGEPQQTVSSGGTTAGRQGRERGRDARADKTRKREGREGREREGGERGGSATMWRQGPALQRSQGPTPRT